MHVYDPRKTVLCPKCGKRNTSLRIRFHVQCELLEAEHLHSWCDRCDYEGMEFCFQVVKEGAVIK